MAGDDGGRGGAHAVVTLTSPAHIRGLTLLPGHDRAWYFRAMRYQVHMIRLRALTTA